MNEAQVEDWFDQIDELKMKLIAREANAVDVERLAASIIAHVRESVGDTLWLDNAIEGIGIGLIWNRNASAVGGETLTGLRLALSSAGHALAPLDEVDPHLRKHAPDIDRRLKALQEQGVFLTA